MAAVKKKPDAYIPYAAGKKIYGGGRTAPNIGPVDKLGYRERDAKVRARRNALLRRMKSGQAGNFKSASWQGFPYGRNY